MIANDMLVSEETDMSILVDAEHSSRFDIDGELLDLLTPRNQDSQQELEQLENDFVVTMNNSRCYFNNDSTHTSSSKLVNGWNNLSSSGYGTISNKENIYDDKEVELNISRLSRASKIRNLSNSYHSSVDMSLTKSIRPQSSDKLDQLLGIDDEVNNYGSSGNQYHENSYQMGMSRVGSNNVPPPPPPLEKLDNHNVAIDSVNNFCTYDSSVVLSTSLSSYLDVRSSVDSSRDYATRDKQRSIGYDRQKIRPNYVSTSYEDSPLTHNRSDIAGRSKSVGVAFRENTGGSQSSRRTEPGVITSSEKRAAVKRLGIKSKIVRFDKPVRLFDTNVENTVGDNEMSRDHMDSKMYLEVENDGRYSKDINDSVRFAEESPNPSYSYTATKTEFESSGMYYNNHQSGGFKEPISAEEQYSYMNSIPSHELSPLSTESNGHEIDVVKDIKDSSHMSMISERLMKYRNDRRAILDTLLKETNYGEDENFRVRNNSNMHSPQLFYSPDPTKSSVDDWSPYSLPDESNFSTPKNAFTDSFKHDYRDKSDGIHPNNHQTKSSKVGDSDSMYISDADDSFEMEGQPNWASTSNTSRQHTFGKGDARNYYDDIEESGYDNSTIQLSDLDTFDSIFSSSATFAASRPENQGENNSPKTPAKPPSFNTNSPSIVSYQKDQN